MLHIVLAQIQVYPGEPKRNFEAMVACIHKAKEKKAHMILFPELCLSGYLIGDLWEDESFLKDCLYYGEEIRRLSDSITIVFGNVAVDWNKRNEDGHVRRYNAFYTAHLGKWKGPSTSPYPFAIKTLLPNYRLFQEARWFTNLSTAAAEWNRSVEEWLHPVFLSFPDGQSLTFAPLICEDSWDEHYAIQPLSVLCRHYPIDLAINLSSSPFTKGKNERRHRLFADTLKNCDVPLLYTNAVGMQNNGKNLYTFDGHSTVYNRKGEVIATGPSFEETLLSVYVEPQTKEVSSPIQLMKPEQDIALLYKALRFGISQFLEQIGVNKIVIGVSGGIDSAVNAALYGSLVPADHLLLVTMPSRYNSSLTKGLAKELAQRLGCLYGEFPIENSVQLTMQQVEHTALSQKGQRCAPLLVSSIGKENMQARDRSSRLLAALASSFGGVFTCNANKTELSVGYATLYGDSAGFLAATADLWKHEVYDLAEFLNDHVYHEEIIPLGTRTLVPSAELSDNQNIELGQGDPLIYPYHDMLFKAFVESWNRPSPYDILQWYVGGCLEEKIGTSLSVSALFPTAASFIEDLEKWYGLLTGFAIAKRIQSPPILSVSRRAFGNDRLESQLKPYFSREYEQLKTQILQKESL